jgi:hypothetical protein
VLVGESSILIATAISLIEDARLASARRKTRKPSSRATMRLIAAFVRPAVKIPAGLFLSKNGDCTGL